MITREKLIRLAKENPSLAAKLLKMAKVSAEKAKTEEDGGKQASFRSKVIRLAHANPELRVKLRPLIKAARGKTVYKDMVLRKQQTGANRFWYVLEATAVHASGKKENIQERFSSEAEAKSWVRHSMQGARWKDVDVQF